MSETTPPSSQEPPPLRRRKSTRLRWSRETGRMLCVRRSSWGVRRSVLLQPQFFTVPGTRNNTTTVLQKTKSNRREVRVLLSPKLFSFRARHAEHSPPIFLFFLLAVRARGGPVTARVRPVESDERRRARRVCFSACRVNFC